MLRRNRSKGCAFRNILPPSLSLSDDRFQLPDSVGEHLGSSSSSRKDCRARSVTCRVACRRAANLLYSAPDRGARTLVARSAAAPLFGDSQSRSPEIALDPAFCAGDQVVPAENASPSSRKSPDQPKFLEVRDRFPSRLTRAQPQDAGLRRYRRVQAARRPALPRRGPRRPRCTRGFSPA